MWKGQGAPPAAAAGAAMFAEYEPSLAYGTGKGGKSWTKQNTGWAFLKQRAGRAGCISQVFLARGW